MKKTIMKKSFFCFISILCAVLFLISCTNEADKRKTVIEQLTHQFFSYVQEDNLDSLMLLYPILSTQFTELAADSIRITDYKQLENNVYEISLVRCYSPDNTIAGTVKKNVTFTFEQTNESDSLSFPFIISNSTGLVNPDLIPAYVSQCGALKNKKYTDKEYWERYNIAELIYMEKAQEIANYISENLTVSVYKDAFWGQAFVTDVAKFTIQNNTAYTCTGFTVYMKFNNLWDGSYSGDARGFYGSKSASLQPYTTKSYTLKIPSTVKQGNYKNYITSIKVEVSAEAVAQTTSFSFNGTEYDAYLLNHKAEDPIDSEPDTINAE